MDAASLQKLAGAVVNGKKRSLNTFLGCSDNSPIGDTLKSSPANAQALLEEYRSMLNSDGASSLPYQTFSRLQVFQALLMIYPCYEIPWLAINSIVSKFVELPEDEAFHCVSTIEMFLDDAVTGMSKNVLAALEDHVRKFVHRLWNHTHAHECSGELRALLWDLLVGVLQFSKRHLSEHFNDRLFRAMSNINFFAENFLIWLGFVQRLGAILSSESLEQGTVRAMEYLTRHGHELSLAQSISVVDASFNIAKNHTSWCRLSIQLLMATHARKSDYVRLERHIEQCLRRLSVKEFSNFRRFCDSEVIQPSWVRLSIFLVLCRCARESTAGLVDGLFSGASDVSGCSTDKDTDVSCGDQVLDYLFPDEEIKGQLELSGGGDDRFLIVEVLHDLSYVGEGMVVDPDGAKVNSLSIASKMILGVLHFGTGDDAPFKMDELGVAWERNMELVCLADNLLHCSQDFRGIKAMLFFSLCVTIIYSTSSPDRGAIADRLFQGLQSKSESHVRKITCIATVGLILHSTSSLRSVGDADTFTEPFMTLLDGGCIDTATFMHIATFMTGSNATRKALLKCSEAILLRNHSSAWKDAKTKIIFYDGDVRAGLFGLLELLRSASWGGLEIQAWGGVSDCLVLNKPRISIVDRKWLYDQITEYLLDDDSGSSTPVHHFLRATIARLGTFMVRETLESSLRFVPENSFIVWEDPSTNDTQTRQVEDIFSLLRLSFFLLFEGISRRGRVSQSKVESKCWDALSCTVQRRAVPKDIDLRNSSIALALNAWLEETEADTLDVSFATLLAYLNSMHNYLTFVALGSDDGNSGFRNDDTAILERCFNNVVERERDDLNQYPLLSWPSWQREGSFNLFGTREIDVDPEWITSLHLSICDLLIESIGGYYPRRVPVNARSLSICKNIVLAIGSILETKRNILEKEKLTAADANDGLSSQTIAHCAPHFFLAASQCVENSLRYEISLETADRCLEATRLFCVGLANTSGGLDSGRWVPLLQSAWALYQTVASEKGATRFIGYLESNLKSEKKLPKTDASVCSLRSIRSSEDVDDRIRNTRFYVVKALEKCLGFGTTIHDLDYHDMPAGEGLEGAALLVARVCRELAQDLRIGLDGHSGGITTEMYESYLKAMQTCAASIEMIARRQDVEVPSAAFDILVDVVNILRDILQAYPMQDAILFRSTLIMAIAEFPSIVRDGARRRRGDFPRGNMSEMLDELFDSCFSILKRWSATRDPNAIPWEDIAGEKHTADRMDKEAVLDVKRRLDTGVVLDGNHRMQSTKVEVRFQRKEIWSWALSCSFVTMEKEWLEAFQAIVAAPERCHIAMDYVFGQGTLAFLAEQRESLRSTLTRAAKLFRSSTPEAYTGAALDVLAMNLPSAPRLRFCHMLAAISKVVRYSIEHLGFCLSTGTEKEEVKRKSSLSFLEALSTLEPWLCFDETENDFVVGTFRWLSILRRKLSPNTPRARHVDTAELLPWVSKVSVLIRYLPASLRKVIGLLGRDDSLTGFADALHTVIPEGRDALLKMLSRKLTVVEAVIPSEHSQSSLPNFPTFGPERTEDKKKRSRRLKPQLRPKKRAAIQLPRSRNSIVNKFMSLDRQSGENDGTPTDAFVDLEDFLVEG